MFDNIGGKIKGLAQFFAWLGIIVSVILGFKNVITGLEYEQEFLTIVGIVIIIVGVLLSWISAFVLYGFGQLVENSDKIVWLSRRVDRLREPASTSKVTVNSEIAEKMETLKKWKQEGLITDAEYNAKMNRLRSGGSM